MKHILTTTVLAAFAFVAQADDKSLTEKARDAADTVVEKTKEVARDTKDFVVNASRDARRAARECWNKTKAYVSDEPPVYREGANATLASLAKEIAEVKAQTPGAEPVYFRTRLQALHEQHEYLTSRLAVLSPEQLKDRSSGPRYDFDQGVGDLEQAIDQAKDGVRIVAKNAPKQP
jgi:hypothetical protein